MIRFKRIEDIKVWEKARSFSNRLNKLSFATKQGVDYDLKRQIKRSALSIWANIAEGYGRRSKKEFAHFLDIAYGSAQETRSHLFAVFDQEMISEEEFAELFNMIDEISKMLYVLARRIRESPDH